MGQDDRNAARPPRAPKHGRAGPGTEARPRSRWPLPRLILLLGAVLLAFGLVTMMLRAPPGGQHQTVATGTAAVGGPFRMVDQNGRAVNESLLDGKWTAIFFGYTYCPDVCPATLTALKVAKDRLGPKAKDLQVVFVTVDPARDTPAQLRTYLSSPAFPQPIVGLTGTAGQVDAMAKAYKAFYRKNGTGPDYLMDPRGRFHGLVSTGQGIDSMTLDIGAALGVS